MSAVLALATERPGACFLISLPATFVTCFFSFLLSASTAATEVPPTANTSAATATSMAAGRSRLI